MSDTQPNNDQRFGLERSRNITDNIDRGIAELREQQSTMRVDTDDDFGVPKIEDVDGVGPATADKLRDAGVDHVEELSRLTPGQIEHVDGIGPRRADKIARRFQYDQQVRFEKSSSDPEDVRRAHANRSRRARIADRSFNAQITLNEDKWLSNPEKYDFPGVDTVPEQRRAERARAAARRSGTDMISAGRIEGQAEGRASGGRVDVDPSAGDPVSTLAHEIGHVMEPNRGFAETEVFGDSEELRNQAAKLSKRRRFVLNDPDVADVRDRLGRGLQDEDAELFADAVGSAIEEPRAARREAPELMSEIEQQFGDVLPGRRG